MSKVSGVLQKELFNTGKESQASQYYNDQCKARNGVSSYNLSIDNPTTLKIGLKRIYIIAFDFIFPMQAVSVRLPEDLFSHPNQYISVSCIIMRAGAENGAPF